MMEASTAGPAKEIIRKLADLLGDRLVALYRFGSGFGQGPAVGDRLLLVLDRIDVKTLDTIAGAGGERSAEARVNLRVYTAESLLRGADAFPALTVELLNTRQLLHGEDVLSDLQVDRHDLRLRVEQSLRRVYRELVQAYLDHNEKPEVLAKTLRRAARRIGNLFEGVLHAASLEVPVPPTPQAVFGAIRNSVLEGKCESLERLHAMASYEISLEHEQLAELYGEALECVADVITYVDQMD